MAEIIMNTPGVTAQSLHEGHMGGIIELMNLEGWYYYDHHELDRYLVLNQDCFTLLKDGRVAGSIFTTNYGNQAWIGNIIVARDLRGMGLAARLIRGVVDHLRENRHVHTFRLGSVPLAIGLYRRAGFRAEAFTTSQQAELPLAAEYKGLHPGGNMVVERLEASGLKAVADMDERYFKSRRQEFLTSIYRDSIKGGAFCLKDHEKVVGFLMLRRRQASKNEGRFAEGPDFAYRLGPCCVLPEYGVNGFKALLQEAIRNVHDEVRQLGGSARMYAVFPRNADKREICEDTGKLARAMAMDRNMALDRIFDEHDHIFGAQKSAKNEEQWKYMEALGFRQEYFEQVMSCTPGEAADTPPARRKAEETRADTEGIFASATPGDKA